MISARKLKPAACLPARQGFTLIELMVAVLVAGILVAGGLAAFRGIGTKQVVKQAGIGFQANLRLFQQKALSGEKPTVCTAADKLEGYWVRYVDSTDYSLQAKCGAKTPPENIITLPEEVEFIGSFGNLFFPTLKSGIEGAAPETITLTKDGFSYEITVEKSGMIKGAML